MNWLRSTLVFVVDLFFGCRHSRLTRPFTLKDSATTYKVCLECGRHLTYSLEKMRLYSAWELYRVRALKQSQEVRQASPLLVTRPMPVHLFEDDLTDSNAAA